MQWRNTTESFGVVSKGLHWLMALVIFGLFGLGLYMVELSYYDSWYRGSLDLHKSLGLLLAFTLLFRLLWKLFNAVPRALSDKRCEVLAGHLGHWLLYGLLLVLVASGYLISTADGRDIAVFELFSVPALPWSIANQEDIAGDIHEIVAWSLIVVALGHALAALKHHFVDRDATLTRMLWQSKRQ